MKDNEKKKKEFCKWKKYIYKTFCPKEHESGHPYWAMPENLEGLSIAHIVVKKYLFLIKKNIMV